MLLWDHLHEKAKFYCPTLSGVKETTQLKLLTANEIELIQPYPLGLQYAFRDDKMVNHLLEELQNCIQDKEVPLGDAGKDPCNTRYHKQLLDENDWLFRWSQVDYCDAGVRALFLNSGAYPAFANVFLYFRIPCRWY